MQEGKYFLTVRENILEERGSAVLAQRILGDIFFCFPPNSPYYQTVNCLSAGGGIILLQPMPSIEELQVVTNTINIY